MSDVKAEIQGLEQLRAKLRAAGPELATRCLEKALKEGGAVIENAMRVQTGKHVVTGELLADLHTEVAISSDGLSGQAKIGFGKQGYVARFVEFGHRIVGHGLLKKDRKENGHVPAHPFMRPAFDESKAAAKETVVKVLSEGVKEIK